MSNASNTPAWSYGRITSTTTVKTGSGEIGGIFVASASSTPTIKVEDGSTVVVNTFTPTAGAWHPLPFAFRTSLVVTIGGTVDCTVAFI